ncbi:hypothetical protein GCM10022265_05890 [Marinobacter xestospongiae]
MGQRIVDPAPGGATGKEAVDVVESGSHGGKITVEILRGRDYTRLTNAVRPLSNLTFIMDSYRMQRQLGSL